MPDYADAFGDADPDSERDAHTQCDADGDAVRDTDGRAFEDSNAFGDTYPDSERFAHTKCNADGGNFDADTDPDSHPFSDSSDLRAGQCT